MLQIHKLDTKVDTNPRCFARNSVAHNDSLCVDWFKSSIAQFTIGRNALVSLGSFGFFVRGATNGNHVSSATRCSQIPVDAGSRYNTWYNRTRTVRRRGVLRTRLLFHAIRSSSVPRSHRGGTQHVSSGNTSAVCRGLPGHDGLCADGDAGSQGLDRVVALTPIDSLGRRTTRSRVAGLGGTDRRRVAWSMFAWPCAAISGEQRGTRCVREPHPVFDSPGEP